MDSSPDNPHVLYRFFSATGQLLYVGITMNPPQRFKAHGKSKAWWDQIRGITVETYLSRRDLLDAERRAIQIEKPLHNVAHNRPSDDKPKTSASSKLQFHCEECGGPADGADSYLLVSHSEIVRFRDAWAQFNAARAARVASGDAMADVTWVDEYPEVAPAQWLTYHDECNPLPEDAAHRCELDMLQTEDDLIGYTACLMSGSWARYTNWPEFLLSFSSDRWT